MGAQNERVSAGRLDRAERAKPWQQRGMLLVFLTDPGRTQQHFAGAYGRERQSHLGKTERRPKSSGLNIIQTRTITLALQMGHTLIG